MKKKISKRIIVYISMFIAILLVFLIICFVNRKPSLLEKPLTLEQAYDIANKDSIPARAIWDGCQSFMIVYDNASGLEESRVSYFEFNLEYNVRDDLYNYYTIVRVSPETGKVNKITKSKCNKKDESSDYINVVISIEPIQIINLINNEYDIDILNYFETNYRDFDMYSNFRYEPNNIIVTNLGFYSSDIYIQFEIDSSNEKVFLIKEVGLLSSPVE